VTGLNGACWRSGAASGADGGPALKACCQSAGDSAGGTLSVPVSGGSSSSGDCWPNSLGSLVDGHRNVPSSSPLRDSVPAGPFTGVWSCSWSAKAVPLSSDRYEKDVPGRAGRTSLTSRVGHGHAWPNPCHGLQPMPPRPGAAKRAFAITARGADRAIAAAGQTHPRAPDGRGPTPGALTIRKGTD
jgi:hypothetical protein